MSDNQIFVKFKKAGIIKINRFKFQSHKIKNFQQFPLRLAYGLTVYKVQGQTITGRVFIDGKGFTRQLLYVALTRVKHRKQLFLRNINWDLMRQKGPCKEMKVIRDLIKRQKRKDETAFPQQCLPLIPRFQAWNKPSNVFRVAIILKAMTISKGIQIPIPI